MGPCWAPLGFSKAVLAKYLYNQAYTYIIHIYIYIYIYALIVWAASEVLVKHPAYAMLLIIHADSLKESPEV